MFINDAIILPILIGIFLVMVFLLSLVGITNKRKKKLVSSTTIPEYENLFSELNQISQKLDEIVALINDRDTETVDRLKFHKKQVESELESRNSVTNTKTEMVEKRTDCLFFTIPDSNGVFADSSRSDIDIDGDKFYKVVLNKDSATNGLLFYNSNSRDLKAINRSQSYLDSVCEIENSDYKHHSTKIETKQPAEIELIEGKWTLKSNQRVLIRFT